MNEQKLSQRLATVAKYVPTASRIADIGSDHAYLPAWLILNEKISYAIAGEVVKGPFESAAQLVRKLNLAGTIDVRLGNGLEVIQETDSINVVTIAGMGGTLISDILTRGVEQNILTGQERLILQPNVAEKNVRTWLQEHSYKIQAEEVLFEDGKFYEVIMAEKSELPVSYSAKELKFGPFLVTEKSEVFKAKWQEEIKKKTYVLGQLETAKNVPTEKIVALKESIADLQREVSG